MCRSHGTAFDDADVLVEAEDGAGEEERLGDVVEQTASHVVDVDHLVGHELDAAYDEQHGTGILRDFEALFIPYKDTKKYRDMQMFLQLLS